MTTSHLLNWRRRDCFGWVGSISLWFALSHPLTFFQPVELSIWRTKAFCPPQVRPHLWHRSLCLVELKSPEGWKKGPLRANRPCPHQFPKTSFLPCNTSLNHVSRVPLLHPTPCRAAGQLSDLLLGTQSWALEELLAPLKASAALESPNAERPHLYLHTARHFQPEINVLSTGTRKGLEEEPCCKSSMCL